jgi:hypothetical protein
MTRSVTGPRGPVLADFDPPTRHPDEDRPMGVHRSPAAVLFTLATAVLAARADDPPRKPAVKVTAEALMKEAAADPKAAAAKYQGKLVAVTGPVSSVDSPYAKNVLTLAAGKRKPTDASGLFVDGKLAPGQAEKGRLLARGQKVALTGEVVTVAADRVTLAGCTFAEVEKVTLPTVTAKELAAAYAKAPAAAARKYGDLSTRKEFVLTGVVRELRDTKYAHKVVVLEPGGKPAVTVTLSKEDAEGLKKGDAVRVKADCRGLGHTELEGQILCDGVLLKGEGGKK